MVNRTCGTAGRGVIAVVAAGLAGGLASAAYGQGRVINLSGATLLQNFLDKPAATNDYIDVDGDGLAGIFGTFPPDQLAVYDVTPPFVADQHWIYHYRITGSVNGYTELLRYAINPAQGFGEEGDDRGLMKGAVQGGPVRAVINQANYINNGLPNGNGYNAANPGGHPFRAGANYIGDPSTGNVWIDIAPIDVPSTWAVNADGGSPIWSRKPNQPGYGKNPRVSVSRAGSDDFDPNAPDASAAGGLSSQLPTLTEFHPYNFSTQSPNAFTIFDQELAYAPIAAIVNHGTGLQQATITELQHLFGTGRGLDGENLMVVTRDVGSGTRNAFQNCIGQDPSWGNGDNIGLISNLVINDVAGPKYVPTNKRDNANVEVSVRNSRLGIGYAGAERGASGSTAWLTGNRLECLAVKNDIYAGGENGTYNRPTIDNVLSGDPASGYVIGGPAVLATVGDPRNQAEIGGVAGNTNPRMRNPNAAAFLNNIRRSTEEFISVPANVNNDGMPGELLATIFVLTPALDNVHSKADPLVMLLNTEFNANLQSDARARSVLRNPAYQAYNTTNAGRIPTRAAGSYTDGNNGDTAYYTINGTRLGYDISMNDLGVTRNKIAGDFNQDGQRNINDAADLVAAFRFRSQGTPWTPPVGIYTFESTGLFCPEIAGDFNNDGNFDAEDLRYWADGLAKPVSGPSAGKVDRKAGFIALDTAFGGNLFGTQKSTGTAYNAGDSRADIAGSATNAPTRGFIPASHDGNIDIEDLKYIKAQYACNPFIFDAEANWTNLAEAVHFDLSADLNGDLVVNAADVAEFYAILGTCPADFNLDGFVDFFDLDSYVEAFDTGDCLADFNDDGFIDFFDIDAYVEAFEIGC